MAPCRTSGCDPMSASLKSSPTADSASPGSLLASASSAPPSVAWLRSGGNRGFRGDRQQDHHNAPTKKKTPSKLGITEASQGTPQDDIFCACWQRTQQKKCEHPPLIPAWGRVTKGLLHGHTAEGEGSQLKP